MKFRGIAIAVLVVLVIDLGFRVLAAQLPDPLVWDNRFTQQKVAQLDNLDGGVDVLLLGSSIMNVAADPKIMAATSSLPLEAYNASLPGSTHRTIELWAADVAVSAACPAVVVLELSPRVFNDASQEAEETLNRYRSSLGRLAYTGEADLGEELALRIQGLSGLFSVRSFLQRPRDLVFFMTDRPVDGWTEGRLSASGYDTEWRTKEFTTSERRQTSLREGAFAKYSVGGREYDSLRAVISSLSSHGVEVVLVEMPLKLPEARRLFDDPDSSLNAYADAIASLVEMTGVYYAAASEWVPNDPDFYADEYHFNGRGTARFSSALADYIASYPEFLAARPAECAEPFGVG